MDLRLEVERSGKQARLCLAGGLIGVESAVRLRDAVEGLVGEGARRLTLDLGGLSYIDSIGLGELVSALKHVTAEGGTLVVTEASPRIDELLRLTLLDTVLRPARPPAATRPAAPDECDPRD